MADGDLYMTVTVTGAITPVLVSEPRRGIRADDQEGRIIKGTTGKVN